MFFELEAVYLLFPLGLVFAFDHTEFVWMRDDISTTLDCTKWDWQSQRGNREIPKCNTSIRSRSWKSWILWSKRNLVFEREMGPNIGKMRGPQQLQKRIENRFNQKTSLLNYYSVQNVALWSFLIFMYFRYFWSETFQKWMSFRISQTLKRTVYFWVSVS